MPGRDGLAVKIEGDGAVVSSVEGEGEGVWGCG